jgi:hypothetical protein
MSATKREPQRNKNFHNRGKGDSVKEITEYWGDTTIEEIHNRIVGRQVRCCGGNSPNAAGKG